MTEEDKEKEKLLLEQRKVKALEKIANTLDALTVWVEEIEKQEWSDRIQYYLSEWYKTVQPKDPTIDG
jgi:uncharacterized LabA/DUF88 family protein